MNNLIQLKETLIWCAIAAPIGAGVYVGLAWLYGKLLPPPYEIALVASGLTMILALVIINKILGEM